MICLGSERESEMTDKQLLEYLACIVASANDKCDPAHRAGILEAGLEQVTAVLLARRECE